MLNNVYTDGVELNKKLDERENFYNFIVLIQLSVEKHCMRL